MCYLLIQEFSSVPSRCDQRVGYAGEVQLLAVERESMNELETALSMDLNYERLREELAL